MHRFLVTERVMQVVEESYEVKAETREEALELHQHGDSEGPIDSILISEEERLFVEMEDLGFIGDPHDELDDGI